MSEIDQILSDKPILLSSAGTKYTDLYYSEMNSSVEVVESTAFWQNRRSLTSKDFGQDSQVNMPVNCFLGQCILRLALPPLTVNQTVCRGWGLRMIKQIRYQIGSSSSTPQVVLQNAMFSQLMMQCETEEKRSLLLQLCGDANVYKTSGNVALEAYVPLLLPFSSVCEKLMYDASLLGQPITIFIQFENNARAIYGGSAASFPSAFTVAEVLIRTRSLSNPSKSLKNAMIADPNLHYPFPFVMPLSFTANPSLVKGNSAANEPFTVQFNQFQNSDLLAIAVTVVNTKDLISQGGADPAPYRLNDIKDIQMTYNGITLFNFPGWSHRAASCYLGNQQSSAFNYCQWDSAVAPGSCKNYLVFLPVFDFTLLREACVGDHVANTFRIPPGGALEFTFTLDAPVTGDDYEVRYTCFYNAMLNTRAGTSSILTA